MVPTVCEYHTEADAEVVELAKNHTYGRSAILSPDGDLFIYGGAWHNQHILRIDWESRNLSARVCTKATLLNKLGLVMPVDQDYVEAENKLAAISCVCGNDGPTSSVMGQRLDTLATRVSWRLIHQMRDLDHGLQPDLENSLMCCITKSVPEPGTSETAKIGQLPECSGRQADLTESHLRSMLCYNQRQSIKQVSALCTAMGHLE